MEEVFSLSETQVEKKNKWIKEQIKKSDGVYGPEGRFRVCFIPIGLGDIVEVADMLLKEHIDITEL